MQPRKCGLLSVLTAASLVSATASAGSIIELADWSALPTTLASHDARFVTADGKSMKARLVRNGAADFVVATKRGQITISHQRVVEIYATTRDSSSEYCTWAFFLPLALLTGGPDSDRDYWRSLMMAPMLIPWAAGGIATTPVALPILYFKSRHTYHFKVRP